MTERAPGFESLSIGIWVKVGTRHEQSRIAGISHFLEHMLFKGTEKRTAHSIALEVDRVGGEFNAFTAREYTCFHILCLNRDIDLAMDILGDVLLNSQFDPEELERERKVILQEISMVEDNPEELLHDLYFEQVYGRQGLGRNILGSVNSIRKMKRRELIGFFRKHYRPDQLVVSVSGDVTHETVRKKLKPLIRAKWPGRPTKSELRKARAEIHKTRPKFKDGTWWVTRNTEQVHILWGVPGPHYHSKDRFAALLLNTHVGGGMSSVLFQEIREKHGLAYSVYSTLSPFTDVGMFTIYAATGLNQVPLCLRLIDECMRKLCKDLLTDEELEGVKTNLKGSILLSADNVESRMSNIAKAQIVFGKYFSVPEVLKVIDQVTAHDIRRIARRLVSSKSRAIMCLGPKPTANVRARVKPKRLDR